MKRRFSCREISLIDQMIQTIGRDLFLPERLGDDARSIGWCTFLHTYQKYPAQFLWAGVGGWARAYLEIQTELRAFQLQETSRYYTPSVDQPLSPESKVPLLSVFRAKHADFRSYVCLRDYMQRLPEDEKWLAGTLSSGYTLEEIPVLFCCEKGTGADPQPAAEEYDGVFEDLTAQYKKIPTKNVACLLELGSGKATAVCGGCPGSDDKLST